MVHACVLHTDGQMLPWHHACRGFAELKTGDLDLVYLEGFVQTSTQIKVGLLGLVLPGNLVTDACEILP